MPRKKHLRPDTCLHFPNGAPLCECGLLILHPYEWAQGFCERCDLLRTGKNLPVRLLPLPWRTQLVVP